MKNRTITHINLAKGFRGGERQTLLLVEELSKSDLTQKLFVRKNSELGKRCINIKNLQIVEISKPYMFHLSKLKDSSLIHAHEAKAAQIAFATYLLYKIPYIITRRVDIGIKNNFLNRAIYEKASRVVSLSNAIKNRVLKLSQKAKTIVIPDAITTFFPDNKNIAKLRERFDGKFIITNVAALEEAKGQHYIIEVAKKLLQIDKNIHFLLLGSGKDEAKFKELAYNLPNITFVGFVNNVGDYLSISDMFLFPTLSEGFGSSILDAMSFKIPVIASNIGGICDIIQNNTNGILVNPRDVDGFFTAITTLYNDKNLRESLSTNAYKMLKNYTPEIVCMEYKNLYEELFCL